MLAPTDSLASRSISQRPRSVPPRHRPDRDQRRREIAILKDLWAEQSAADAARGVAGASMDYVASHFETISLERRLRVLDDITPHIQGRVLEWGCQHAIDSCVYRLRFGEAIELYGCDVFDPGAFPVFHAFSGLRYEQLRHHSRLEYPEGFFDVVTSNGVLEHVPLDFESVPEIFRVLRPGGTFVVTCLPNRYSYTEALQRLLGNNAHDRLYTMTSARTLLEASGFTIIANSYAFMLPTMLQGVPSWAKACYQHAGRLIWSVNAVLERVWMLNRLASNLTLVARKPFGAKGT